MEGPLLIMFVITEINIRTGIVICNVCEFFIQFQITKYIQFSFSPDVYVGGGRRKDRNLQLCDAWHLKQAGKDDQLQSNMNNFSSLVVVLHSVALVKKKKKKDRQSQHNYNKFLQYIFYFQEEEYKLVF